MNWADARVVILAGGSVRLPEMPLRERIARGGPDGQIRLFRRIDVSGLYSRPYWHTEERVDYMEYSEADWKAAP